MSKLLDQLLDESAERTPGAVALRFEGEAVTYSELAERANRAAHGLRELGVGRGDLVGIYARKGIESAVAMYAILKAGAAYVPIDPWLAPERVGFVVADCGFRVLFTDRGKLSRLKKAGLQSTELTHLVGLEEDNPVGISGVPWKSFESLSAERPERLATDQDLSYIFYTSGTTGEPKGMMHTHRSGMAFVDWAVETFAFSPRDRIGNHAPLHFDLSIFDYMGAAKVGATTVIVPEEYMKMPAGLAQLIEEERITVWYSTPVALVHMALRGALDQRDLSRLRVVFFAGEPLATSVVREFMKHAPQARYCHGYGVTEANITHYYFVSPEEAESDEPLPIGRLCSHLEACVLDGDDELPEGEAGELAIRGPALMQGYWRRPELNRTVFWGRSSDEGRPFYRTGDLVEPSEDGIYRFLGRKDRQIKSRGHRVELDEVQAAVSAHPSIQEAAVLGVGDGEGSYEIAAAVTLRADRTWDEAGLVRSLRERLAAYAVPSRFLVLTQMPRTSAGKIEWRALRDRF